MTMFDLLVRMGYKEIEVGFPAASETDFAFVRQLVESDRIPDDVTISVLTQAREDLIERSVQSLVGVRRANIHLYNALAPLFRRVVFRASNDEIKDIATRGTEIVMKNIESYLDPTVIGYEYSPEIFTSTELPFSSRSARRSPTSGSPRTAARSSSTCRRPSRSRRPTSTPTRSSGSAASSPGAPAR